MQVFINPYVIRFRFSYAPIHEGAMEHSHEKTQWKHRAPRTGPDTLVALFYVTNVIRHRV